MPRPRLPRSPWTLALTAAVALALAACGGPEDAAGGTEPVVHDVPEIPVQVTAPPDWERGTRDGAFLLRAPSGTGSEDFRANVVVTGKQSAQTVDEAGAATTAAVASIPGWVPDPDGQGPTTLAGLPAYRVAGTYDAAGTAVAQEIVAVRTGDGPDAWVVDLTASYAVDDADGAAQARAILESVQVAPAG